jgi:hypothetical protein
MIGPNPAGIITAMAVAPRDCIVYAPAGSCTRFRQATSAQLVGQNVLGGVVLSAVVRVADQAADYVVPPAWIDPVGAPAPVRRPACVVIPFPVKFREPTP